MLYLPQQKIVCPCYGASLLQGVCGVWHKGKGCATGQLRGAPLGQLGVQAGGSRVGAGFADALPSLSLSLGDSYLHILLQALLAESKPRIASRDHARISRPCLCCLQMSAVAGHHTCALVAISTAVNMCSITSYC